MRFDQSGRHGPGMLGREKNKRLSSCASWDRPSLFQLKMKPLRYVLDIAQRDARTVELQFWKHAINSSGEPRGRKKTEERKYCLGQMGQSSR